MVARKQHVFPIYMSPIPYPLFLSSCSSALSAGGDRSKVGQDGATLPESMDGRLVHVMGVFDHNMEVLVGLRSAPEGLSGPSNAPSMATNPMGYFLFTPLTREDGSMVVINRGWVPQSGKEWSRPTGKVSLTGVIKHGEKRGMFSPPNNPTSKRLLWVEMEALSEAVGYKGEGNPILVEVVGSDSEDAQPGKLKYPLEKRAHHFQDFHVTPLTHLMYAATWFTLAGAASAMTWILFKGKSKPRLPSSIPPRGNPGNSNPTV
ncbi:unnamed protein product [Choristocarpus tenellus]